jgi:hypothetical protein
MQDCVRGPTSSGSVSLGRRGETLTSTRRSYDRDPAEYSSKVQQRRRHSAMFSEVRTCLLSLNDAQRDPCRHFASKGLGVRVPLAPLLVKPTFDPSFAIWVRAFAAANCSSWPLALDRSLLPSRPSASRVLAAAT